MKTTKQKKEKNDNNSIELAAEELAKIFIEQIGSNQAKTVENSEPLSK